MAMRLRMCIAAMWIAVVLCVLAIAFVGEDASGHIRLSPPQGPPLLVLLAAFLVSSAVVATTFIARPKFVGLALILGAMPLVTPYLLFAAMMFQPEPAHAAWQPALMMYVFGPVAIISLLAGITLLKAKSGEAA